ncbi:MAG: dUTP diphosphatase [Bernardetiaceae bacterium]|nr:dUTP diphosphatase [Bernardetiaceae bacterium]
MQIPVINRTSNPLPIAQTEAAAGVDLHANITENITFAPLERKLIPTGIFMALPKGYEGQVRPRSGLAYRKGLTVLNAPGTIDADYRGELKVLLVNLSSEEAQITPSERIAQLVVAKHETIEWLETEALSETDRGQNGYGSTGA